MLLTWWRRLCVQCVTTSSSSACYVQDNSRAQDWHCVRTTQVALATRGVFTHYQSSVRELSNIAHRWGSLLAQHMTKIPKAIHNSDPHLWAVSVPASSVPETSLSSFHIYVCVCVCLSSPILTLTWPGFWVLSESTTSPEDAQTAPPQHEGGSEKGK